MDEKTCSAIRELIEFSRMEILMNSENSTHKHDKYILDTCDTAEHYLDCFDKKECPHKNIIN